MEIRPMSLKKRERDELVKQIKDEAIRLYQYRDELEVKGDDSVVRSWANSAAQVLHSARCRSRRVELRASP